MSKKILRVGDHPVGIERGPRNLWRITIGSKVTGVEHDNPKVVEDYARRSAQKLIEESRRK